MNLLAYRLPATFFISFNPLRETRLSFPRRMLKREPILLILVRANFLMPISFDFKIFC